MIAREGRRRHTSPRRRDASRNLLPRRRDAPGNLLPRRRDAPRDLPRVAQTVAQKSDPPVNYDRICRMVWISNRSTVTLALPSACRVTVSSLSSGI